MSGLFTASPSRASLVPACVVIRSSSWVAPYLFHWVCQGHWHWHSLIGIILWGSPSLLRDVTVLWGSPVVPYVTPAHSCVWYWSLLANSRTGIFAERCWTLILAFEVVVSVLCWLGIPAWLTYLMGSDICLGICSLKELCLGDGVTGPSLGLWDDSTCFAHQLPKPMCCTVMLLCLGCWGWSSNPMESVIAAPWQLCPRPKTRQ